MRRELSKPTGWKAVLGSRSIRFRLTVGSIATILVMNTILSLVVVLVVSGVLVEEVQTRVRLDLNSARGVYDSHVQEIDRFLQAISARWSIPAPLEEAVTGDFGLLLDTLRQEGGLDILTLIGPAGQVIYRAHNHPVRGDDISADNPLIARVLREWRPISGTVIVAREALVRDGSRLAEQAYFQIRPTPAARPSDQGEQTAGMLIAAAVPLVDINRPEERIGILYAANLLNRRYDLVDTIKEQVFLNQTYRGQDIGTATIFQGDLRISTNVPNEDGTRGIGTRMSAEVTERVLNQGRIWADRAFVLNDWYITAYEPIRDPDGQVIGALYVGLLEKPFTHQRHIVLAVFLPLVAFTTLASLGLLFLTTRHVLRPIDRVIGMTQKVIAGDMTARVGIRPPGEMGVLCSSIDEMADAVYERGRIYEAEYRQQIIQSEKLASIGRLASGIAHEINNPLTGVLTFSSLLQKSPTMGEQEKEDLDLIIRETTRVRDIVRGLLDFARESKPHKHPVQVNEVIRRAMMLVRSQKEHKDIVWQDRLAEGLPMVLGDRNQIEQVVVNLSLNACEAMPDGGTLTIESSQQDNEVVIVVQDTGIGISEENLPQIMDPFFTTKPVGQGTGLGLSVVYGIVHQHAGTIDVQSQLGSGTTFTVRLPTSIPGSTSVENQTEAT
ncbi:MAG: cache domain-containing protein [Bradymonadales bacterium]|nr:cache domain-containing protein [Bradymonadales bacterium]